jgi:hypothetical protein
MPERKITLTRHRTGSKDVVDTKRIEDVKDMWNADLVCMD